MRELLWVWLAVFYSSEIPTSLEEFGSFDFMRRGNLGTNIFAAQDKLVAISR